MALLSLTHPGWVAIGLGMILVGVWLIRWANRNNMTSAIAGATTDAAVEALRHGTRAGPDDAKRSGPHPARTKKIASYGFRNAMSQLFGVIGFISVVVGLMLAVLGAFYG